MSRLALTAYARTALACVLCAGCFIDSIGGPYETGGGSPSTSSGGAAGVGGSSSATGDAGSPTTSSGGEGGAGGEPATGAGGSGGSVVGLDDGDLFARYWIDEGSSGLATGTLNDAASNPEPLTLSQFAGTTLAWTEPSSGQRGLEWDANVSGGQASTPLAGSKFTQLWGRTNLTVEAVTSSEGNSGWHARLFHLGDDSTASTLQLSTNDGLMYLYFNDLSSHIWDFSPGERVVLHLVIDTALAGDDRARLFRNGDLMTPSLATALPAGAALAEEPDPLPDYFVIGNTPGGTRSWVGTTHYLAIYTTPFTPQRIANHAQALATVDDQP